MSLHTRELWAVQQSARNIFLEHTDHRNCTIQAEFSVTALGLTQSNLALSNGRSISTYTIDKVDRIQDFGNSTDSTSNSSAKSEKSANQLCVKLLQTFNAECLDLALCNQNVFCLTAIDVVVYSIGGVILHKIQASSTEGKIIGMDMTGSYLSIFTMNGYIKTYDTTRHDPKILFPSKSAYDLFEDFGEVIMVKCNTAGTHLSLVIANRSFVPKPVLYCWDFERNHLMELDLHDDVTEKGSFIPVSLWWDVEEPRLMAMEIKSMKKQQEQNNIKASTTRNKYNDTPVHYIESNVWVLFYSEHNKLIVLEVKPLASGEQLLNICLPCVVSEFKVYAIF